MILKKIQETASFIRDEVKFEPEVGIILGTGLGGLADQIEVHKAVEYKNIPNFPVSTVEGHKGQLIFGHLGGKKVVAMQGRFHYYEGYEPQEVIFPVRVMKFLGITHLFVSNASGGINTTFQVGDLMVITDHINLIPNPLVGPNIEELGPRFPDMNNAYDPELIKLANEIAEEMGIRLQHGCYVGGTGPTFETQKEYAHFKAIGGDTAGMSTTPEVIAARHMGLTVFGMSVITNVGLGGFINDHTDVQVQGAKAAVNMTKLFIEMISRL